MNNDILIVLILVVLNIVTFSIGYILGKITNNIGVYSDSQKAVGFFEKQKNSSIKNKTISIDDSKFVAEIKTDNLEKKYDTLGDTKVSKENISSSISKLKNMKG
jgi:hypothetical protein